MTAQEALTIALVSDAEVGILPPCRFGDEWFSDNPDERDVAVAYCQRCKVIAQCAAAADEQAERHGVWGGSDRTRRARR